MLSSRLNKTHDSLQMTLQQHVFRRINLLSALVDGALLDFCCFPSFVEAGQGVGNQEMQISEDISDGQCMDIDMICM